MKGIIDYLSGQCKDKDILHVGIADSALALKCMHAKHITGTSSMEHEIEYARFMRIPNYTLIKTSKYNLFTDNEYDYIIDNAPFGYVQRKEQIGLLMIKYYWMLRQGGVYLTTEYGATRNYLGTIKDNTGVDGHWLSGYIIGVLQGWFEVDRQPGLMVCKRID
jgi:hypothetical protein